MKNCGVSRWDDPAEINRQLKELTSQEIWEVDDDYYDNVVMKYFDEKCKASKAVYEESQKYIPGGVQHNLAFNKPFPMCMAKTEGAYLYDQDGNRYIDFLQAGGPTILGSNYPAVREKVIELLNTCGPVTGLLHESEMMIAKEITKHMPNVEMFRMLGSGTESVMAGTPYREDRDGQEEDNQDRRSLSRLVGSDGIRAEDPGKPRAAGVTRDNAGSLQEN